jgi:hypothetical protein
MNRESNPSGVATAWQWPLHVTKYDRDAHLRKEELAEVNRLVELWESENRTFVGRNSLFPQDHILFRLILPLEEAGEVLELNPIDVRTGIRALIREMQQRQNSYWAWSASDWQATLGRSGKEFGARFHCSPYGRTVLILSAYLLCEFNDAYILNCCYTEYTAKRLLGKEAVEQAIAQVIESLSAWGYGTVSLKNRIPSALSLVLLVNRSPDLKHINIDFLENLRQERITRVLSEDLFKISLALERLGFIEDRLGVLNRRPGIARSTDTLTDIPASWLFWCNRWKNTNTSSRHNRSHVFLYLLRIGRWIALNRPELASPENWTRADAIEMIAVIDRMTRGETWSSIYLPNKSNASMRNDPLPPMTKRYMHYALCASGFFPGWTGLGVVSHSF